MLIIVATLASRNGSRRGTPELIARGFAEPGEPLLDEMRDEAAARPRRAASPTTSPRSSCSRSTCTTGSASSIYDRTRRRPMILPVVVEV